MRHARVLVVALLSVVLVGPAWAQGKPAQAGKPGKPGAAAKEDNAEKQKREKSKTDKPVHVPGFAKEDVNTIRAWFHVNRAGLPPGLAKRQELPPGLQRHLEKNGQLPPGLQKQAQPLPPDLEVHLPRLPRGYKRVVIGGHIILLEERRATVVDIIRDVIH
jgi:hypothetical protein